jgi:hypothetical protein
MAVLTRRKYPERVDCWHIYYGDVCVGTIARRTGCPVDVDQWEWGCGVYPGTEPGQGESGTAVDFDHARAGFEAAWQRLLPTGTEADSKNGATNATGPRRNTLCGHAVNYCLPSGRTA